MRWRCGGRKKSSDGYVRLKLGHSYTFVYVYICIYVIYDDIYTRVPFI